MAVALAHPHAGRVLRGDEEGVAVLARQGVVVAEHHRVELLSPARGHQHVALGDRALRGLDHGEVGPAVGGRELPAVAEPRSAPLHLVAGLREGLDARVHGHDPGDLVADGLSGRDVDEVGAVRVDPLGELAEDLPLGAGLPHLGPADLGAEGDAPLGGGLGAAVALLVAGGGGQQHHDLARIHQHLGGDHDVLVHAHGRAGEAVGHQPRVGQHVEEVAAARVEDLEAAVGRGLDHLLRAQAGGVGHVEAPLPRELGRRLRAHRHPAREGRGVGAHLRAALDPGVPADGHQAGARTAHVAPRQRQVDDRPHVLRAERVLGEAHRPDEDGGVGGRVHGGEPLHVGPRCAREPLQLVEPEVVQGGGELVEARRVLRDEALVEGAGRGQHLHHAGDERDVAADVHREELVGHPASRTGRSRRWRAPSSARARARGTG